MSSVSWKMESAWALRVRRAVEFLRGRGFPEGRSLGLVLGSGLGGFVDQLETVAAVEFPEVPGFSGGQVVAHAGRVVAARAGSVPLLVLQGRSHAYEGLSMADVVLPAAVMAAAGCDRVVLTNAAGGLRPGMTPGELAVLTDLFDLHLQDVARGILLPDPSVGAEVFARVRRPGALFDGDLSSRLGETARAEGIGLRRAVYASVWGPHYEESATIGALRRMGADVVGMSTGPEAAYLRALGVRVAGLSCITNVAVEHGAVAVTHDEVVEVGGQSGDAFSRLLSRSLAALFEERTGGGS